MRKIGRHVRGHLVAYLALFFALGGTSFAAANALPRNSVGSAQIKNGAIQKVDLSKRTVSSLRGLRGLRGVSGPAGPQGPAGATGATGAPGQPGAPNPNATALNGFSANQLVRAASASAGNTGDPCSGGAAVTGFVNTTFTSLVSKAITAPAAGVLVITGRVASELDSTSPAASSLRLLGRLTVDGTQAGAESETSLSDSAAACKEGRTMALAVAVPVTAGSHTVALEIAKSTTTGGTGKAYVGNGSFTTIFVPFGNDGAQGVLSTSHVASTQSAPNH